MTRLLRLDLSDGLNFTLVDGELGDLAVNDDETITGLGLWWRSSLGGAVDALG
jgi:hypothetical protein